MNSRHSSMGREKEMILSEAQMEQILGELIHRTQEEKLEWYRDDDRLFVGLPNQTTVEIHESDEGPDFVIQIKGPTGTLYGQVKSPKKPDSPVGNLYTAASQQAARSLFAEIMDSLQLRNSASAEVVRAVPRVSAEQAARVLQKMEGDWNLDFSRGIERATIKDGAYFVNHQKDAKFHLKVLAWNEQTSTAEVAKDKPDGRRLQIEHLTISGDAMTGFAKHDGHKLHYKRSSALPVGGRPQQQLPAGAPQQQFPGGAPQQTLPSGSPQQALPGGAPQQQLGTPPG